MTLKELPLWTVAYRRPRANTFRRVTNWSGTWNEASGMATRLMELQPELEVWYVPTQAAEADDYSQPEDRGNILTHRGTRVRMTETGTLPPELIGA